MTNPVLWLAAVLVLGFLLVAFGRYGRKRAGLGDGRRVSLDDVTLRSPRLGLIGRPDRLIRQGGMLYPEEWKSSHRIRPEHRLQLGVYFLLIEDQMGMRPPYGTIVTGDGKRHRVANSEGLRAKVLAIATAIRAADATISQPITVRPRAGQCRSCGQRANCGQARL